MATTHAKERLMAKLAELGGRCLWQFSGPNKSSVETWTVGGSACIILFWPEHDGFEIYFPVESLSIDTNIAKLEEFATTGLPDPKRMPDVEQGQLIPGCTDRLCAVIVTTEDIMLASLNTENEPRGISEADARNFLSEFGDEISEAFLRDWLTTLGSMRQLESIVESDGVPYCESCEAKPALPSDSRHICDECPVLGENGKPSFELTLDHRTQNMGDDETRTIAWNSHTITVHCSEFGITTYELDGAAIYLANLIDAMEGGQ